MPTTRSTSSYSARKQRAAERDRARQRRFARFEDPESRGNSYDPLRHPEDASVTDRTKRSWILVILTLLIPGSAQILIGQRSLGRFALRVTVTVWVILVLGLLLWLVRRSWVISLGANPTFQLFMVVAFVGLGLLWLILWISTLAAIKFNLLAPGMRPVVAVVTVLLMLITSGGMLGAALMLNASRSTFGSLFSSGPAIDAVDGRYNFLVMGVDAGEGRVGLRPDSISVASINEKTGQIVLFSIPRNFQNAQFSDDSPLWSVYPSGYSCGDECIINALYTDVMSNHTSLYPDADDPGAEAMMDAASGILDLDIQGYVMIDMAGFAQLIDAMGGVTVQTGGWVIHRGQRPDGQWGNIWWGPDTYTFGGDDALAFARSRQYSSDYARIRRQQCIQQAMLSQFDLPTLLTRFQAILDAGEQTVETNLPASQLGTFLDLGLRAQELPMQRLTIGAPDFGDQGDRFSTYPDFDQIHTRVDQMLADDGTPQAVGAAGPAAGPVIGTVLPASTLAVEGDESTGAERGPGRATDPDDWPPVPTQPDGSPLTQDYLIWLDDTGQSSLLEEASSTNQYCIPVS